MGQKGGSGMSLTRRGFASQLLALAATVTAPQAAFGLSKAGSVGTFSRALLIDAGLLP